MKTPEQRALEPAERAAAKERQKAGLKQGKMAARSGNLPERGKGKTRDKVAAHASGGKLPQQAKGKTSAKDLTGVPATSAKDLTEVRERARLGVTG